jgi:SAM-dependent methyltransferase
MMARRPELELLDSCTEQEAARNLADLERINRWFGGHRILGALLRPHMRRNPEAVVLDAGAADGATIRALQSRFPMARFLAVDISERNLRLGRGARAAADARRLPMRDGSVDIVVCSLFLHHFTDRDIQLLWEEFRRVARVAVLGVDLHRHPVARRFLPLTKSLFGWEDITVHDGVASVNAAFVPAHLRALLPGARVRSHWPWFRLSAEWRRGQGTDRNPSR